MVVGSLVAAAAIFAWRVFFSAYVLRVVARGRLVLVGASPREEIGWQAEAPAPLHGALDGCVERDPVLVQDGPGGPLDGGSRLHIRALGGDFGGPRLGQQALILDDEKAGRGSHLELSLLGRQRLLLQLARFDRRFVGRSRAAPGDERVLHLAARLVFELP